MLVFYYNKCVQPQLFLSRFSAGHFRKHFTREVLHFLVASVTLLSKEDVIESRPLLAALDLRPAGTHGCLPHSERVKTI